MPGIFTDNMVLQRQTEAPIWGKTAPGRNIQVATSWNNQVYRTTSAFDGSWQVKVKTTQAGGPYQISVSDGKSKEVKLKNILIGEVWICSGQSNMEMPLAGWGKINSYEKEIAEANYPQIRLFQVEKATGTQPLENIRTKAGWQECSPATIPEFSSVAYFFGRNLHQTLNVPIGLINTSWGGTLAEAWISGESLGSMPYFKDAVQELRDTPEAELQAIYQKKFNEWSSIISGADEGLKEGWTKASFSDKSWQTMKLPSLWEEQGMNDFDGIVWFRKTINIPTDWKNRDMELHLGMVDDNEVTYFNGQEIGRTEGYNVERIYKIPGKLVRAGKAVIVVRVTDNGGEGGIYGEEGQLKIIEPNSNLNGKPVIGIAGKWKYKVAVDFSQHEKAPQPRAGNPNSPSALFNAMINPLAPYAMQGAIWYQGEANESRPTQYRTLLPLLIRDWRNQWNRNFPFYYVQLAGYKNTSFSWPELREAQLMTLHLENTGMVVTTDIGNPIDIHPKNKQDVGLRLALAARANIYGEKIIYSGPIYESYRLEENKVRIYFKYNQRLKAKENAKLKGFEIAGPDHRFYPADATIENSEIVVSSTQVKYPVAVRYAWANSPVCNLYNEADLPASPFRTDDWEEN
ncbi:MAG: 9-O-acetylesterase [Prevotellaceae bacterium]|nr:9-O-acetylesterase [Prevotellaceae bacterium]